MHHILYDVTAFEVVKPYTLRVHFSDQTEQVVDFQPVLHGEMHAPLRNLHHFNQVPLDAETKTLVWPNGADFDPHVLHEWPRVESQLSRRLQAATLASIR